MECAPGDAACVSSSHIVNTAYTATPINTTVNNTVSAAVNLVVAGSDLGPSLRVATWVLVALSCVFLNTRLYCKWRRHRTLHLDDYVLVASWVMLVAAIVCTTIEISYGFGKHAAALIAAGKLDTQGLNTITLTGQLAITFGICAQAWSKTSWAITLLRISSGRLRGFMWFALVSMNLFFAGPAFGYWLQCQPIAKAWKPLLPGTCWQPEIGIILGIVASCKSFLSSLFCPPSGRFLFFCPPSGRSRPPSGR